LIEASQALGDGDVLLNNGNVAVFQGLLFKKVTIGVGVKGNPQTNVGVQIHRDLTSVGTSSHGFNCADYYAEDTQALNCFGSDIQIGDGTQTTEVINHVHAFQDTDQIDLGSATISAHQTIVSQPVLLSGLVSRSFGVNVVDPLGVRDTPGFGVPGFEANGTATSNNFTGVAISASHGMNAKSLHIVGPFTDAGVAQTTGAARSDFEGPVIMRQADSATSKTTGALQLTDGGIGSAGDIWSNGMFVANSAATYGMNSAAGVPLASLVSTSALTSLTNIFSGTLEIGISNTPKLRLLTDRFLPVTDASLNLGDATHRWIQLYATTTTISTSDANTKTQPLAIDDKLLDAWADVQHVVFQFKDAVAKKGNSARVHVGHIAQQVHSALESKGVDGFRYALLCKDEKTSKVIKTKTIERQKTEIVEFDDEVYEKNSEGKLVCKIIKSSRVIPLTEKLQVFNEDGSPMLVDREEGKFFVKATVIKDFPVMEFIEEEYEVEEPNGEYIMGLRYEQCLIVEAAYLRREIDRLKSKLG
jgi:hypothetical protein